MSLCRQYRMIVMLAERLAEILNEMLDAFGHPSLTSLNF